MSAKEARKANKPHVWTRARVFLLCLALTGTCIGQGFFVFGDDGHEAVESSYEVTEEKDAAKESFVGTDGLTYSREEYFYLWIYDESGNKVGSYSEWENPQNPLRDVLSYVDPDGLTYYLIPTSYFAAALSDVDESPEIEEGGFTSCPFHYQPDAGIDFSIAGATGEAVYRSVTNEAGETAWYVRVQDTGSYSESTAYGTPHRSNVCYTPSLAVTSVLSDEGGSYIQEDFWLWLYDSSDTKVLDRGESDPITDALTYTADGQSYHLLPLSYFSYALTEDGFAFNSQNTLLCPFFYIPSAYSSGRDAATGEAVYFSLTPQHALDGQTAETSFYVRVQDTTGLTPNRSNVYYDVSRFADDAGVIYSRQSYYYLWIYDESEEKRAGYSEWNTQSGGSDNLPITDVLSYEDGKQTYYLIPVSYFTDALSDLGYEFSEEDPGTCPLWYIPNANNSGVSAATGEAAYYAVTVTDESGSEKISWYVRVQDTGSYSASTAGYGTPHRSNVYYLPKKSHGEGCIVLNLGNGNGSYNFADYAGDNAAGADLRYTVDVSAHLTESADGTFHAAVRLPADEDLGAQFTVIEGENETDAATAELGEECAYDYRLIGWVDIEDGSYYDVSDGAAEADLLMTDEEGKSLYHVFYADWIAASYDHGSSTDKDQRGSTEGTEGQAAVSTADFVTIHMFDYNDLFNLYSSTLSRTSALSEAWSDSGSLYQTAPIDAGFAGEEDVLSQSFVFVNNGTADDQSGTGPLQWVKDQKNWNIWTGTDGWTGKGKNSVLDAAETWGIESKSDAWVPLLFDPSVSEETLGVHYVGDADYLFWIDEEGYYAYDSKSAAASYSLSEERFYVYDAGQTVSGTAYTCFLPYNSYGKTLSAYDGSVNYWFGMSLEVEFYLPNAIGEEAADEEEEGLNQVNGGDMVFEFSGDDDIIIFIDDELTLDMSGNHDEAFGSINFSKGTVEISMAKDESGSPDPNSEYYQKKEFSLSSGVHTLSVCYMERGGWASNLSVRFNVTPFWKYQSGPVQTVTAEKVWTDEGGRVLSEEELSSYGSLTKSVNVGLFDGVGEGGEDKDGYTKKEEADGTVSYTYAFENDAGEKHTYVYTKPADKSLPTLSYTLFYTDDSGKEIKKPYLYTADDQGLIFDESDCLFAWLKEDEEAGEVLYLRIDVQTLSSDNDWFFAWEMLNAGGTYLVQELSRSDAFAVTETSDALSEYLYWSVIGDEEIEESFSDTEPLAVILTEAAQEASTNLGSTNEALGYVIVAELSDKNEVGAKVVTKQVPFSQISTLTTMTFGESSLTYYVSECGVTTQSAVESLGEGAVWYVVDASVTESDPQGEVEAFYLYCYLDGEQYWLTSRFDESESLAVTGNQDNRGIFYYNSLGELRLAPREEDVGKEDLYDRVVIDEEGRIYLDVAEVSSEENDVRIFTYKAVESSGFSYTAKNALLQTDVVVEKMDATSLRTDENGYLIDADGHPPGEEHLLSGAAFILWRIAEDEKEEDAAEEEAADALAGTLYGIEIPDGCHAIYYVLTKDGSGSEAEEEEEEGLWTVCWTSEKEEATLVCSNEAGQLLFYGLCAGTYYLTEVIAPEGYLLLSSPTWTIEVAAEEETGSLSAAVTDAGAGSKVFGKRDVFYYLDSDGTRIYESTDRKKADDDTVVWLTETRYVLLNYPSYALPNTRGEGTHLPLFTAAGAALILLAAVGLMLARRSKKY